MSGLLSEKDGFTFIRLDMSLGQYPRRLVAGVCGQHESSDFKQQIFALLWCCVLGQNARSTLAPSALR